MTKKLLLLAAFMTVSLVGVAGAQTQLQIDLAEIQARYAPLHRHEFFTTTYPTYEENLEIMAAYDRAAEDKFDIAHYNHESDK